tara:strand:- start:938 stop:1501 length:564 start_codon:yes stop_codon:yes gene_type:complete
MRLNTIEDWFTYAKSVRRTICGHLDTLRRLASDCDSIVEFGIRSCSSSSALLAGCKGTVYSWDIEELPHHGDLRSVAGDKWEVTYCPSQDAKTPDSFDMLFHDTFHNYKQVKAELDAHADKARKYLVLHDSVKNAISGGENHTRGNFNPDLAGFRLAVDELMIRDPSWFIKEHHPHDDGLLVLERRK